MRLLLLLFATFSFLKATAGDMITADKVLLVTVSETGTVTVGRDTVNADNLARYVQERFFKSYLGTGKMHDLVVVKKTSADVPDMVTDVIIKEIQDAQKKALTQVSLQKYRKTFDNLDHRKQAKHFPAQPIIYFPVVAKMCKAIRDKAAVAGL